MDTLQEAKKYLRDNWQNGVDCPCCGQFVKRYRRQINSSMSRVLIDLYHFRSANGPVAYLHVPKFLAEHSRPQVNDYTKLTAWELLEPKRGDREDGSKRNGYWRITEKGLAFVEHRLEVPKYALMYNQKFLGFLEGETVGISATLGKKFNYEELMRS